MISGPNASGKSQLIGAALAAIVGKRAVEIDPAGAGPSTVKLVLSDGRSEETVSLTAAAAHKAGATAKCEFAHAATPMSEQLLEILRPDSGPRLVLDERIRTGMLTKRDIAAFESTAAGEERGWASAYNYHPADRFTLTLSGTECGCDRSWQGTKESLGKKCAEIVRAAIELAPLQAEQRRQREAAAIEQQRRAEVIAEQQRRVQARAEQVKQARLILEALARRKELLGFLDQLETDGANLESPYRERLPIWIGVVRKELTSRDRVREMLEQCLSLPSWSTWPPAWWPIDESRCTAPDRPPGE